MVAEKMLWSTLFLFFFLASSSLCSSINNYVDKYYLERDGKHYFNLYAFKKLNIVLDAASSASFNFKAVSVDVSRLALPIELWFSTTDVGNDVHLQINRLSFEVMDQRLEEHHDDDYDIRISDVRLKSIYQEKGLNFIQESGRYVIKIESMYTPEAVDAELYPCLFEWPTTAHLQIPADTSIELDPLKSEYEVFEDNCGHEADKGRCDILDEGVSLPAKGVVQFMLALLEKDKGYEILHPSGRYSPIYSIVGSPSCTKYSLNITFADLGNVVVNRNGEAINIATEMGSGEQALRDLSISKVSDVKFYFDDDLVHFFFDDTQHRFQFQSIALETPINDTQSQTKFQIFADVIGIDCNTTVKLIVGHKVKLMIPKSAESAEAANLVELVQASDTESGGFPLGAIIGIACFCLVVLLAVIAGGVYLVIRYLRKQKSKRPTAPTVAEPDTATSMNPLAAVRKAEVATPVDAAAKKPMTEAEIAAARLKARKYEVPLDEDESPFGEITPFDLNSFKKFLPPAFFTMREFYEENPLNDEDIEWGNIPAKGSLVNNFWELLPFISFNGKDGTQDVTNGPNNYMYFIVRDLANPDNKVFHKFGARLFEPINLNAYEVVENESNGKRDPQVIRVFILSHDPPAVECIVDGYRPDFFMHLFLDCFWCTYKMNKPRHFTSTELLSRNLHLLPLGYHIVTSYSEEEDLNNYDKHRWILTFKGGKQTIPLDLKYATLSMHYSWKVFLRYRKPKKEESKLDKTKPKTLMLMARKPRKRRAKSTELSVATETTQAGTFDEAEPTQATTAETQGTTAATQAQTIMTTQKVTAETQAQTTQTPNMATQKASAHTHGTTAPTQNMTTQTQNPTDVTQTAITASKKRGKTKPSKEKVTAETQKPTAPSQGTTAATQKVTAQTQKPSATSTDQTQAAATTSKKREKKNTIRK